MDEIEITGYVPGAIGWLIGIHGRYYAKNWNLGMYFEARVATELAELMNRFDPAHDGMWLARKQGQIIGAIVIDGGETEGEGGRLRWFIVSPEYQGIGLGNRLMEAAIGFCKQVGFRRVYLTTFKGLDTARHLYEKFGFRLCAEVDATELTGSSTLVEQILELHLPEDVYAQT